MILTINFNTIDILTIVVSLFALFVSFYSVFLSKKVEIVYVKFEKICLTPIESLLSEIESEIHQSSREKINFETKMLVTESLVDLQMYILALKNGAYSSISLSQIFNIFDDFSDELYDFKESSDKIKLKYLTFRIKLLDQLYSYAISEILPKNVFLRWFYSNFFKNAKY